MCAERAMMPETKPPPRPRVLVVDDEDAIRETLREVLSEEGYEVESAADGAEALALLARGAPPRVVLLDLMMPRLDGWEVLRRVRAAPALDATAVVVISASGLPAPPAGADHLLPKPFELPALLALLATYRAAPGRVVSP
jgi:CheY-like chemotaxis protein